MTVSQSDPLSVGTMRPYTQNRRATSVLMTWTDIAPDEEPLFNEWYNREHMRDRIVALPGFVRGRRYIAVEGAPKYLAFYEAVDSAIFSDDRYVAIISDPDPRSRHFITRFQNAIRTIARIEFSFGEGEGAALALWKIADQGGTILDAGRLQQAVQSVLASDGVIAAHLISKDEEALALSARRHARSSSRTLDHALMLEAMDMACMRRAARSLAAAIGPLPGMDAEPSLFQIAYRVSP